MVSVDSSSPLSEQEKETENVASDEKKDSDFANSLQSANSSHPDPWWDNNWQYRVPIDINSTSEENLTDYQVRIDINLTEWIDAEYLNETGSDIRFTDVSGQEELDFWIENSNLTDGNSTIWVNIPSLTENTEIYMYMGNPDAISKSNGINTFILFENFENYDDQDGEIPENWTDYGAGEVELDTEENADENRVLKKTSNNDPNGGYRIFSEEISDFEVTLKTNRINDDGGGINRYAIEDGQYDGYGPLIDNFYGSADFAIEQRNEGSPSADYLESETISDPEPEDETWYILKYRKYGDTLEAEVYNKTGELNKSLSVEDDAHSGPFDRFVIHGGWEYWTDDIIIRKYTPDEPEVSIGDLQYSELHITCFDIDGRRVEGAEVHITNSSQPSLNRNESTDENGEIFFVNIPTGIYNITVNYTLEDNSNSKTETVYYLEGYEKKEHELELYVNLWTIDFEVDDADGEPFDFGYVNISANGNSEVLTKMDLDSDGTGQFIWNASKEFYNYSVYYHNTDYSPKDTYLYSGTVYRNETSKTYAVNQTAKHSSGNTYYVEEDNIYLYDKEEYSGPDEIVEIRLDCWEMTDNLSEIKIRYSDTDYITEYEDETSVNITYRAFEDGESLYQIQGLRVDFENTTQSNGTIQLDLTKTYYEKITVNMSKLSLRVLDSEEEEGVAGITMQIENNATSDQVVELETDSDGDAYGEFTSDFSFWYLNGTTYNFTLEFREDIQIFDVIQSDQSSPQETEWYNYTLTKNDEIVFSLTEINYSKRLAKFTNTQMPESEVTWGDNMTFSVFYNVSKDGGDTWENDSGCSAIFKLYRGSKNLLETYMNDKNTGNFTIEINTSDFSAGGTGKNYWIMIEGQKDLWSDPEPVDFAFKIDPIDMEIGLYDYNSFEPTDSYSQHYDELVNITLSYNQTEDDELLPPETLEYSWTPSGEEINGALGDDIKEHPEDEDYYYFQINTSSGDEIGTFTFDITATRENYTDESRTFTLEILNRKTSINDSIGLLHNSKNVWIKDAHNFTFSYTDFNTEDGIRGADELTYVWYKLDEDGNPLSGEGYEGGGTLIESEGGLYVLDFNTTTRATGDYAIFVTIDKDNYERRDAFIDLSIKRRTIETDLSANFDILDGQIEVIQGEDIMFQLDLNDPTKEDNPPLTNASVMLNIGEETYEFQEKENGEYVYKFSTEEYDTFFSQKNLQGNITISKENYIDQNIQISIVVGMEEGPIPGIPTLYFLMLVGAIVAVAGSLVVYRGIQRARIPTFVKKARKMKSSIKSRKDIPESVLYPSKEELMIEKLGNRWERLGISLSDILGTEMEKGKKISKDKGGAK
ncbi:MAG: DUF2341 domain-containing protein [Promethearchaeia archaeon]